MTLRTKTYAAIAVICLLFLLLALARRHARTGAEAANDPKLQPVPVEVAIATVGPMATTVPAQGTLAPKQGASARVASAASGRLLEVRVLEGQRVAAGEVLAVIDNRPQQYQAQVMLQAARSDRDHSVQEAQIALETARTELRKVRAGARPQEIAQAQQTVIQAQAARDHAQQEVTRVQYLFTHGVASQRQKEEADTALVVANSSLEAAHQQLSLVQAGARPEEAQAAQLSVSNAQQVLALARESGDAKVRQAEAELAQLQGVTRPGPIAGASTLLRAPIAGVVTRRLQNPGDMADPTAPVVEVADDRSLDLVASLPAEAGARLHAGLTARITVEGVTGQGRVLSVGQVDPQTGLLSARISVDNAAGRLRIGAFAQAAIVVSTNPQAVLLPKSAVIDREGKALVLVVGSDHRAHAREVTLGGEAGVQVEATTGVRPGEQVVRSGQYALPDGAPVAAGEAPARP